MFSKIIPLNSIFEHLFNGILYFSVAQKLVDFVIFTCLRILWKYLDLRIRETWNVEWKYGKIWKYGMELKVLGTLEIVL